MQTHNMLKSLLVLQTNVNFILIKKIYLASILKVFLLIFGKIMSNTKNRKHI